MMKYLMKLKIKYWWLDFLWALIIFVLPMINVLSRDNIVSYRLAFESLLVLMILMLTVDVYIRIKHRKNKQDESLEIMESKNYNEEKYEDFFLKYRRIGIMIKYLTKLEEEYSIEFDYLSIAVIIILTVASLNIGDILVYRWVSIFILFMITIRFVFLIYRKIKLRKNKPVKNESI